MPLLATRSAEAASLIERIDAALPGSRAGAWGLLALGALALVLVVVIPRGLAGAAQEIPAMMPRPAIVSAGKRG